jgi:glycerophosphoryl diester phosphodiesterase
MPAVVRAFPPSTKFSTYARGKIGIYVDVKQVSAKDLVGHIVDHGMTDNVVIYSGRISKETQDLNPRLKVMPEAGQAESAERLVDSLHPKVLAFDAGDFKPEVIAIAKEGWRARLCGPSLCRR